MMGMIAHVQFMNLCSAGDMGVPKETAAMSNGMGWANLQFKSPFASDDAPSSKNGARWSTGGHRPTPNPNAYSNPNPEDAMHSHLLTSSHMRTLMGVNIKSFSVLCVLV